MPLLTKSGLLIKLLLLFSCFFVGTTEAKLISVEGRQQTAEAELIQFKQSLSYRDLDRIRRVPWDERNTLSPRLRRAYLQWTDLREAEKKWAHGILLKQDLMALHGEGSQTHLALQQEADQVSATIMEILWKYRKEWGMLNSALMHNVLVNMKVKEQGFCWHWVEKFLENLRPMDLRFFELHWGVAYEGKMRENNALVIAKPGTPFDSGLALDAWRASGRPFWKPVKKDRFPWVKRNEANL